MNDLTSWDLSTVAGVGAITTGAVQIIKRLVGKHRIFGKVPIFIYAIIVAIFLTILATFVFHSLQGDFWQNMWKSLISAVVSSGFYEWLRNGKDPMEEAI